MASSGGSKLIKFWNFNINDMSEKSPTEIVIKQATHSLRASKFLLKLNLYFPAAISQVT